MYVCMDVNNSDDMEREQLFYRHKAMFWKNEKVGEEIYEPIFVPSKYLKYITELLSQKRMTLVLKYSILLTFFYDCNRHFY